MLSKNTTKGRPEGNKILRGLRSKAWLLNVQSRCGGRNNCQLDRLFGPRQHDGSMVNTADRLKMFEAIEKNGSIPNSTGYVRMFNLIEKVDSEKGYEGTAAIIQSPFWRLLENDLLSLADLRQLVVNCVDKLSLATIPGEYKDDGLDELEEVVSSEPKLTLDEYFEYLEEIDVGYDLSMGEVFPYSDPSLDHIALIAALAFEAIYSGNMKVASYQIDIFRTYLKEYCNQKWLSEISDNLYQYGENRMLEALKADALNGLPDYSIMLSEIQNVKPNSAIDAFLTHHQRMLWRR